MKAKTLSAVVAVSSLMVVSGTVLADAHQAYQRAFYGDSGVQQAQIESSAAMGKAAYGTPMEKPFAGPKGGVTVLTETGLAQWKDLGSDNAMGRPAFGSGGSGIETAHNGYHRAFYGD